QAYKVAERCRNKGFDPESTVEIPLAKDMAERVVGLISVITPQIKDTKIVERINELEKKYAAQDWRVALTIALEVTEEKFCKFKDKHEAMEVGIRVGIAYITNGVVSSPIEGFTNLKVRKRKDGKEYFALFFSGPIRSAGGTGASVSVLIGDYIRMKMGYEKYDPSEEEINRMVTEIYDYHEKVTNLQYLPSEEEIKFIIKYLPVQVDGDPSEKYDVSNYKGLERIETDKIRNGPCLVIGEGICQKATKLSKNLSKWGKDFDLSYWNFLDDFLRLQKKIKSRLEGDKDKKEEKIKPDFTFIKDLVAGRPVFTYPLTKGGFRLRYGRGRNSGLSSQAINPITMYILNKFLAIGTQLKVERPGKSTVLGSCDVIEGPIVKLNNGDVLFPETVEEARNIVKDVMEILFLGDILINYGDFLNRNHTLVPAGYCEDWWAQELKEAVSKYKKNLEKSELELLNNFINNPLRIKPDAKKAIEISLKFKTPLHPRYTYRWDEINKEQLIILLEWYKKATFDVGGIILPLVIKDITNKDSNNPKRILELLGVPHKCVLNENIVIQNDWAIILKFCLENVNLAKDNIYDIISSKIVIKDKSGTYIGARMGRPEKAKMRKLTGAPQVLFPVGNEGGRLRSFQEAIKAGYVNAQFPLFFCNICNGDTIYPICENCGSKCQQLYKCFRCGKINNFKCHDVAVNYAQKKIDIKHFFTSAAKKIKDYPVPELIKGVRGTSNRDHTPENLVKGLLRAVNNIYVNKDGTIRYDMTEMPLTHFKPKEIGTSISKLRELGYIKDIYGNDLNGEDQILELRVQDVILPDPDESLEEGAKDVLFKIANFVDDLLVNFYNEKKFYDLKMKDDLVGHYIVGLAPHISAGMVGRVIGFSKTQVFLAHPCFHSALRR
ncbi:MAG: DNA polymerase II large subunit, partial [Nanoarchaeota archaeon]